MTGLRGVRIRLAALYAAIFAALGVVLVVLLLAVATHSNVVRASVSQAAPGAAGGFQLAPGAIAQRQHSADFRAVAIGGLAVLLLAGLAAVPIGWLLSGRALAPVEESFESQRRFIANASHELRTPLTVERTLLQVALADPEASAASLRAACEELLANGRDQERLLDSLLTLAAGERGIEHAEPVDLATLVSGVDGELELAPAWVSGDPALLRRLVANLCDNAVQHNDTRGWVRVQTGSDGRSAFLEVANTGPLIGADQVESLFEPFRRLGAERTGERHGLGLSIARAITTAHGGSITATPRPDGGLRVRVSLPAAAPAAAPASGTGR